SRHGERVRGRVTGGEKRRSPFLSAGGPDSRRLGRLPFWIIRRSVPGAILTRNVDPLYSSTNLNRELRWFKSKRGSSQVLMHLHDNLVRFCVCTGSGCTAGSNGSHGGVCRSSFFREQIFEIYV